MTLERWDVLRPREIEDELRRAHALIYEKSPEADQGVLALPEKERAKADPGAEEDSWRHARRPKGDRGSNLLAGFCVQDIEAIMESSRSRGGEGDGQVSSVVYSACFVLAAGAVALVLYPLVWLVLLPFRVVGIAVGGVLELVKAIILLPARVLRAI